MLAALMSGFPQILELVLSKSLMLVCRFTAMSSADTPHACMLVPSASSAAATKSFMPSFALEPRAQRSRRNPNLGTFALQFLSAQPVAVAPATRFLGDLSRCCINKLRQSDAKTAARFRRRCLKR